jgi:hypothetical protein
MVNLLRYASGAGAGLPAHEKHLAKATTRLAKVTISVTPSTGGACTLTFKTSLEREPTAPPSPAVKRASYRRARSLILLAY